MRISVIIPSFYPAKHYGGSIFATLDLYKNFSKNKDFSIYVSSTNANGKTKLKLGADGKKIINNRFYNPDFGFKIKYYNELIVNYLSVSFLVGIWSDIYKANVVHIQSIFSYPTPISLFICWIFRKKVILSPRGSFAKWGLVQKQNRNRKKIWIKYLISPFIKRILWHATSKKEKKEINMLYPKANVFIMPDGIISNEYIDFDIKDYKEEILETNILPDIDFKKNKIILFLGRIHEVKGLDKLLYAFAKYKDYNHNSILIIAGDDHGFKKDLFVIIRKLKLQSSVYFPGKVYGKAKQTLYNVSDLFVLPSHTENFGIVAAEALASGLPVLASNKTPWEDIEAKNCGKFVNNDPDSLFKGMIDIFNSNENELKTNALEYAKFFDWDKIVEIYKKILLNI